MQNRIHNQNWTNYNEANDYSYDGTKTAFADWNRVTLYRNGALVWGTEPTVTAPDTQAPTAPSRARLDRTDEHDHRTLLDRLDRQRRRHRLPRARGHDRRRHAHRHHVHGDRPRPVDGAHLHGRGLRRGGQRVRRLERRHRLDHGRDRYPAADGARPASSRPGRRPRPSRSRGPARPTTSASPAIACARARPSSGTPTGTTFTVTGLAARHDAHYTVVAFDAAGNVSAASNAVTATTTPRRTRRRPPRLPASWSRRRRSTTVSLAWTASTDNVGVTGYRVREGTTQVGTSTTTSFTVTGLAPSSTHTYTVVARGRGGERVRRQQRGHGHDGSAAPATLKVQYRAADTSATDQQIKPHLTIVNAGTTAVPLAELTARYWYTRDGTQPQVYDCDYARRGLRERHRHVRRPADAGAHRGRVPADRVRRGCGHAPARRADGRDPEPHAQPELDELQRGERLVVRRARRPRSPTGTASRSTATACSSGARSRRRPGPTSRWPRRPRPSASRRPGRRPARSASRA